MASSKIQGELWGTHAEDWADKAEPQNQPLWEAVLKACNVKQGTNLLDIGCGAAGLGILASEMGASVTGIDASESLIEIARKRIPSGEFFVGDVEDLPFSDASFDVVVACNSIQFADDQKKAVREARRVLKPYGKFGMGMWCEPERCEISVVFRALQEAMPQQPQKQDEPPTLSTRENLVALVESGGFQVTAEGEVECLIYSPNLEEALKCFRSAGVIVGAARAMGDETIHNLLTDALSRSASEDGSVKFVNWFRYVIAE